MKKTLSVILILTLVFILSSCTKKTDLPTTTVRFYYKSTSVEHGTENGVITWEDRVIPGVNNDTVSIIRTYLEGSKKAGCIMPFPGGTRLKVYDQTQTKAVVLLSTEAAMQTDAQFTVASICLARTIMDITNVQSVEVCVDAGGGSEQKSIIITPDNFDLYDSSEDS